jgi:hypothetical protein
MLKEMLSMQVRELALQVLDRENDGTMQAQNIDKLLR